MAKTATKKKPTEDEKVKRYEALKPFTENDLIAILSGLLMYYGEKSKAMELFDKIIESAIKSN